MDPLVNWGIEVSEDGQDDIREWLLGTENQAGDGVSRE